jgi:pimeloyl-ACP methyl ester carboxylesterase
MPAGATGRRPGAVGCSPKWPGPHASAPTIARATAIARLVRSRAPPSTSLKNCTPLLHEAHIPGPYVLVGHSLGGLSVRLFAHEYAADVAGVVLIESMSPSAATQSAGTDAQSGADWLLRLPARIGVVRLLAGPLDLRSGMWPEVADTFPAFSVTPRSVQTWIDEGRGMPESLAEAGAVKNLGAVPHRAVAWTGSASGLADTAGRTPPMSSNNQQLFADKSGHSIEFDQPDAAVGAIVQMVEQIRGTAIGGIR